MGGNFTGRPTLPGPSPASHVSVSGSPGAPSRYSVASGDRLRGVQGWSSGHPDVTSYWPQSTRFVTPAVWMCPGETGKCLFMVVRGQEQPSTTSPGPCHSPPFISSRHPPQHNEDRPHPPNVCHSCSMLVVAPASPHVTTYLFNDRADSLPVLQ